MRVMLCVAAGMIAVATTASVRPALADFRVTVKNEAGLVIRARVDISAENQHKQSVASHLFPLGQSVDIDIVETIEGKRVEIDIIYIDMYDSVYRGRSAGTTTTRAEASPWSSRAPC